MERMASEGLLLEPERDTGAAWVTPFGIVAGHEQQAGIQLLNYLRDGAEVWLRNDLDEGAEGCTCFRVATAGILTMVFGHGWTGEWKATDEQTVLSTVVGLADLNRGDPMGRGSIIRSKSRSG
jgi:hypothetical protein